MPKIKPLKIIQYIVPPIITAGLCFYLYRDTDIRLVFDELHTCSPWLVTLFLLCNLGAMACRALRWQIQLRAIDSTPSPWQMLQSIFGTYAVNLVFPRLGEIWRCSFIARISSTPFSKAFGSMVADRAADIACICLLLLATLAAATGPMTDFLNKSSIGTRIVSLALSPTLWTAVASLVIASIAIMHSRSSLSTRMRNTAGRLWDGFAAIFTMPGRSQWLAYTASIWTLYLLSTLFSLLCYPPTAAIIVRHGFTAVLVTLAFGSLSMIVPANGGIGPWQVAIILALNGIFLLPHAQALTFATINLGLTTLLQITLGIITFVTIPLDKKR